MSKENTEFNYEKSKFKENLRQLKKDWMLYVLLIPCVIVFILFKYKPMTGLLAAFKDYEMTKGMLNSDFQGLFYFKTLFFGGQKYEFWRAFRNTFLISFYGLLFGFPVPIILALFFSEIRNKVYRNVTQILTYLPKFISTVVITTILALLVKSANDYSSAGVIQQFLVKINVIDQDVNLLQVSKYFRPLYIISGIWEAAGYGSIIYFAAIMSIPPSHYEAIRVDGANKLQQIRYVTLPGMAPTLTIMLILRIGDILSVGFEKVLLMYNPKIYVTADVIDTYVYRLSIANSPGFATAAGLFNSVIAMILVLGANFISRRVSETSLF